MTAAACKAVICEEKAQAELISLVQTVEKFKEGLKENHQLRIDISEMIINSNKRLAGRIMKKIQEKLPDSET